jgi:hypothetical protein
MTKRDANSPRVATASPGLPPKNPGVNLATPMPPHPHSLRSCFHLGLLVAFASSLTASPTPAAPADGPTLELPKLSVNSDAPLPALESWRHARVGNFAVLSNAGDKRTQRLLADFQKFQKAAQLIWQSPVKPVAAASIILCGQDARFDEFVPDDAGAGQSPNPSLFLRNAEQIAIIVDLETTRTMLDDPITGLQQNAIFVEYNVDHYRQLYREYAHYLLSQGEVRPPAWLEEGLVQIVMDIDLTDEALILGRIDTDQGIPVGGQAIGHSDYDASAPNAVVGEQAFNRVLRNRSLLPFEEFLAITHDSPEAQQPLGNTLWAKQAYAFVHYCLFNQKQQYREAIVTFANRLAQEPVSEKLFKECFGVGYAQMAKEVRNYVYNTRLKYQKYELKPTDLVPPASIVLTEATTAQIGLLKGDALQLAGHREAAFAEYRAAYQRGARDPAILAGLGATFSDPAMARKFTTEAVRAGVTRPSAYVTLARARLAEFKADPGPDGKLTPTQLSAVLTPLFQARSFPPPLPDVYELIAETWETSSVPAKPEHLAVLDEGVRQFPRDAELLERTARLYVAAGKPDTAASVARLGRRFAANDATRARFDPFLAGQASR